MPGQTSKAARRYAEAAFELATQHFDEYADGLELAAELLGQDKGLAILRNQARPLGQRTDVVHQGLDGRVPETVVRLVCLLIQRGRIDELPTVAREFRRMLNEERGTVDAVAHSAMPLTAEETAALQEKVARMTGRTVQLTVELDESLIGGLTVRVGDTLYDASVRGRLERLRERLLAGAR